MVPDQAGERGRDDPIARDRGAERCSGIVTVTLISSTIRAAGLSSLILASACAGPPPPPPAPPPAAVATAAPTATPALRAQLPESFFPLPTAWAPLPRAPLRPLETRGARSIEVAQWAEADLGIAPMEIAPSVVRLPGRFRGVLLAPAGDPRAVEQPAYVAYGPRGGLYQAWFVSDGRGQRFTRGLRRTVLDGRAFVIDAAMFAPAGDDPWGLSKRVHLVELEIDGGLGDAGPDRRVVATNARVLDGTETFPIDLEAAADQLEARAKAIVAKGEQRADRLFAAKGKGYGAAFRRVPDGVYRVPYERFFRWDDGARELRVVYRAVRSAHFVGPAEPAPARCAPGQPCNQQVIVHEHRVEVMFAVTQRLAADGALVEEALYAPRAASES